MGMGAGEGAGCGTETGALQTFFQNTGQPKPGGQAADCSQYHTGGDGVEQGGGVEKEGGEDVDRDGFSQKLTPSRFRCHFYFLPIAH